jgi:hypothetical protein
MKHKLLILAGVLAVVAALGGFYGKPVAAQIRGMLVQDVDQPARAPFQARFSVDMTNKPVAVAIPKGYRLVIDYITVNGVAADSSGNYDIQPGLEIESTLAGAEVTHVINLEPFDQTIAPGHFFWNGPAAFYADSLSVSIAYTGTGNPAAPGYIDLAGAISGHLVAVGKTW